MLGNEIQNNHLPASLLFHGPDGCGKFLTAIELARILNCHFSGSSACTCTSCMGISKLISRNIFLISKSNLRNTFDLWQMAGVAPAYLSWFYRDLQRLSLSIYEEERYKKDLVLLEDFLRSPHELVENFKCIMKCVYGILDTLKGRIISINKIRELKRYLWVKASDAGFKVAIIDGAENMNEESSNSFLKISEDTPPDSIIILTTVNKELIKETIQSRFRSYRFIRLSKEDKKEIFKEHFGVAGDLDLDIKTYDIDTMNDYTQRFRESQHHLNTYVEIVKEIIAKDLVITFLDHAMNMVKERITEERYSDINKLYEVEALLKGIDFLRKAILYNNVNQELAFTNFMLNNFGGFLQ